MGNVNKRNRLSPADYGKVTGNFKRGNEKDHKLSSNRRSNDE